VLILLAALLTTAQADQTVRAGGTDVAVRCIGTRSAGQPLVVLEAGGGDDLRVWSLVQQPIACAPTAVRL
jgi:hypothetical protein